MLEGMAIASYAIQCNLAFVYLRGEFALEIGQNMVHGSDSPESAVSMPEMILTRVDLPAPLSPPVDRWAHDNA